MSLVAIVARDLMIATRVGEAAASAGHEVLRVDRPSDLPPTSLVRMVFVDWGAREGGWGDGLISWLATATANGPTLVLFGPHADLKAHAAARDARLGPMLARSKLLSDLPRLIAAANDDG